LRPTRTRDKQMVQLRKLNSTMETRGHSKNGASLKSHTSKGNKHRFVIFACLLFFVTFSIYAQETKLRVAVIDLSPTDNYSVSISDAKALTSILTTELVNTNKYRVVERSRIEQIIKELGLQSTQDASVRAAEIGKLLGVHKIITGECTLWQTVAESYYYQAKTNIRLIDVESGDIDKAVTIDNYVINKKGKFVRWLSNREIAQKIILELLK